ncbi:MAG: pentapeptide repeat-containing protein [Chloroflexota bacterium]
MWQRWLQHYTKHKFVYTVTAVSAIVIELLIIMDLLVEKFGWFNSVQGFRVNVITEVFGIGITVVIIERFNRRREDQRRADEKAQEEQRRTEEKSREKQRQRNERIARIILEMRSPNSEEGVRAVMEAREMGILTDGSLQNVDLSGAHLIGANLKNANLEGANMRDVTLSDANLADADLRGADLINADLSRAWLPNACLIGTKLCRANLSNTYLQYANLADADLRDAILISARLERVNLREAVLECADLSAARLKYVNLSGAWLRYANLTHADLGHSNLDKTQLKKADLSNAILHGTNLKFAIIEETKFDGRTVLPDSKQKESDGQIIFDTYWNVGTDMDRYTNPTRFDFWQPVYTAANYDNFADWEVAGHPRPWVKAGYRSRHWNEWIRDGKPTPYDAVHAGRNIPMYIAAGFDNFENWTAAGRHTPWLNAGYSLYEWNEWIRDGSPLPEQSRQIGRIPFWEAAGFETIEAWMDVTAENRDRAIPWVGAGYGEYEWNEWVRDGKPAQKPTDDSES